MGPFGYLITAQGRLNCGNLRADVGRAEMMPEVGQPFPRLGFRMRHHQAMIYLPRFPRNLGGVWGDKIRRNHVRPIAVLRGAPILNHNRAGVGPILGIESAPPPEALNSALKLSNP